ncbi:MAG: dTDP-4-dehydrorhamnose 3,5-epimerase family protein [Alphaproteobacteria bacterium]
MAIEFDIKQSDKIAGVYIITPSVGEDLRGNIWTSFVADELQPLITDGAKFKHNKFSKSKKNVLRGIHGDTKSWKLVTCVYGKMQQVVVDMRQDSDTYLQWQDFIIDSDKPQLILIPPRLGNAYYNLGDDLVYHYSLAYDGDYIDADEQFSEKWNDERIGIKWLCGGEPILSGRDK